MVHFVGIAGGSGSGKTTFAKKVLKKISDDITLLHMDSYYLPTQPKENYTENKRPNFDHPDAFDWNLLKQHLQQLKEGKPIQAPVYDFNKSERATQTIEVNPKKIILFEGIFTLFKKEIRNMLDTKCFLDIDSDIRFTRRLHRDINERKRTVESVIEQYYETVRPMYQKFLGPQRGFADFIIGEESDNAASILASHIREIIVRSNLETKKL